MSRRFTLEQVMARAKADYDLAAEMPEMTPATEERYFGEREALATFLGGVADDITHDTKIGVPRTSAALCHVALRTGDLAVQRAVAAYAMRSDAIVDLTRQESETQNGAA